MGNNNKRATDPDQPLLNNSTPTKPKRIKKSKQVTSFDVNKETIIVGDVKGNVYKMDSTTQNLTKIFNSAEYEKFSSINTLKLLKTSEAGDFTFLMDNSYDGTYLVTNNKKTKIAKGNFSNNSFIKYEESKFVLATYENYPSKIVRIIWGTLTHIDIENKNLENFELKISASESLGLNFVGNSKQNKEKRKICVYSKDKIYMIEKDEIIKTIDLNNELINVILFYFQRRLYSANHLEIISDILLC